jgi:glutamate racemase
VVCKNLGRTVFAVFDSGLGGLTVLRSLLDEFPDRDFVYLGDTARLPYGSKSGSTIRQYSLQILKYLVDELNPDALVIACNSASTQVHESEIFGKKVFNVIDPGVAKALEKTKNNKIGVLATRATVDSQAYQQRLIKINPEVQVFAAAAPLLVPLAEENWDQDPITNLICYRYLQPLLTQGIDTLIMGCTHYPILRESLQRACGPNINLVEAGDKLCQNIKSSVEEDSQLRAARQIKILLTDLNSQNQKLCHSLLQAHEISSIEHINLKTNHEEIL